MISNIDPYESPKSAVAGNKQDLSANFSTLNFWRKLYLVLTWLGVIIFFGAIVFGIVLASDNEGMVGISIWQIIVLLIALGLAIWTHHAVVRRSSGQIIALAIINLIPFFNVIGCLIMFSILRVTKKECEQFNVVKA